MTTLPRHPYRLSDAERGQAISALSEAYAEGRLTAAEFDERLDAASRARFATDLDELFADLPPRPGPDAPARSDRLDRLDRPATRRSRPLMMLIPVGVLVALVLLGQAWLLLPLAFLIVARTMPRPPGSARWVGGGRPRGRHCGRW